jgi:uncharacterized protein
MSTGSASPFARRFVAWLLRHGVVIWATALVLAVPATLRTATLYAHLRSEVEELLPREAPSVRAIDELRRRMQGLQFLGVVVDTASADNIAAGDRFIDDLAARIRTYPKEMVRGVRTGVGIERAFFEKNAPLYIDLPDLEAVRTRIEARRDYAVAHALGSALDDEPPPSVDMSALRRKYEDALAQNHGKLTADRFSNAELHTSLLVIEAGTIATGDAHKALVTRVKKDIAELGGPERYAAGMRVGFSGDVAISVEEVSALVADLSLSSVLVVFAVGLVIVVFYRWVPSVVVLVAPLLLATVYSFAIASLPPFRITELNSNTAFLGSIIVGNGINFGILVLARYLEERRGGAPVELSLERAVSGSRLGTLSAALAAGVAYLALVVTQFRGFRQFGVIGGIGMVMSWTVAFVLMPPLAVWLDRARGGNIPPKPRGIVAKLAPLVARYATPILVVTLVLTGLSAWKAHTWSSSDIEHDMGKLRRADTWKSGEGYWGRRMDALLGQYLTPTVFLTESVEEARALKAAVTDKLRDPAFSDMVSVVRGVDDVLPPDEPAKIAVVEAIKKDLTPAVRATLSPEDARVVDRLLGGPRLTPLTPSDLPTTLSDAMLERDGSFGRTVLVFPKPNHGLWQGPRLLPFVDEMRGLRGAATSLGARPARLAGSLPLSADIIRSISRDGERACIVAFVGVALVVVVIFRAHRTTFFVLASLLVGVLFLVATAMTLGVKVNFANFIAFPITFGIGVDYAVNVMSRYVEEGKQDGEGAVSRVGGAVALCSLTTILGYSSLLLAQNRALSLFGLLAVLGEVSCLSTALIALPATLIVVQRCRFFAPRSST